MENKEPTEAQIKEFWNKLGIEPYYTCENGEEVYDPIDLNNLFKYAVPKVKELLNNQPEIPTLYKFLDFLGKWVYGVALENNDPALALFWAIWEVIHG